MTTPDWLTQRGGDLKLSTDCKTWYVLFEGQPQYSLVATPVSGKFGCAIRQTINGKRVDAGSAHATADDALRAGLDELRKLLGWG